MSRDSGPRPRTLLLDGWGRAGLTLAFLLIIGHEARSQQPPPLIVGPSSPAAVAAPSDARSQRVVLSSQAVWLRLDALFDSRGRPGARVGLRVEGHEWIASLERTDLDGAGFRSWVGTLDDIPQSHVVFTERDGVVSGLIDALDWTYRVRTVDDGAYVLEEIAAAGLGQEHDPRTAPGPPAIADQRLGVADDGRTIDVLILYTPGAQVRAGGQLQVEALASQIISDSNTAFARSGVIPRLRLIGTALIGIAEAASMSSDLDAVTNSPEARALRDATRADVVHLLVASPDQFNCGIAWLLTGLESDFDAYGVSDVVCASSYTATHEIGHNLGSHHAPEDGASGALFPYAFGYKDPFRRFRTVMANGCPPPTDCPRILNFSNPAGFHNGVVTGTPTQNNALSINNTAITAANWRQALSGGSVVPSPPAGLSAQVAGNAVTLSWNSTPGAATYVLQVGSSSGAANVFVGSLGNVTSVSGTVSVGTYFWRILAANDAGTSPPSVESQFTVGTACTPPGAPRSFSFQVSGRVVSLQWMGPATGSAPTSYVVEAGSVSGAANLYNADVGATTALSVAAPPGTYFVRIRARNACALSLPSPERVITVP